MTAPAVEANDLGERRPSGAPDAMPRAQRPDTGLRREKSLFRAIGGLGDFHDDAVAGLPGAVIFRDPP